MLFRRVLSAASQAQSVDLCILCGSARDDPLRNPITGQIVYGAEFLDPSTTSATIPANTLQANRSYNFELDFSDRLNGFDSTNAAFTTEGFDMRTDGSFLTGAPVRTIPEPASILLLGSGLIGLISIRRRR